MHAIVRYRVVSQVQFFNLQNRMFSGGRYFFDNIFDGVSPVFYQCWALRNCSPKSIIFESILRRSYTILWDRQNRSFLDLSGMVCFQSSVGFVIEVLLEIYLRARRACISSTLLQQTGQARKENQLCRRLGAKDFFFGPIWDGAFSKLRGLRC